MNDELPNSADLNWKELEEIWKRQSDGDVVLIDGTPLMTPIVGSMEFVAQECRKHNLEIRVGAVGLWHELEQCGCEVANASLLPYVISDLEEHCVQATKAFLEIGQSHLKRRPSILKMMFGLDLAVAPEWLCPGFDDVTRTVDHIVFRGTCYSAHDLASDNESDHA